MERKVEQDVLNEEKVQKAKVADPECHLPVLVDFRKDEIYQNYDFAYGREPGTTARIVAETNAKRETEPEVEETEAERIKREKANKKYWERFDREAERKRASKDWDAYSKGSERGKTIGLEVQLGGEDDRNKIA